MARIKHPRFQPGRTRGLAGIEFIDGFAEVNLDGNDILRQAFVQHGYGIEETAPAVRPSAASKRPGKAKPAEAEKASEPTNGASNDGDSAVLGSAERAETALDAQFAPED